LISQIEGGLKKQYSEVEVINAELEQYNPVCS
jgi:hypothetical protein